MEEAKSFYYLAREEGGTIKPYNPPKEFTEGLEKCIEESIKQSRLMQADAMIKAREIFV